MDYGTLEMSLCKLADNGESVLRPIMSSSQRLAHGERRSIRLSNKSCAANFMSPFIFAPEFDSLIKLQLSSPANRIEI